MTEIMSPIDAVQHDANPNQPTQGAPLRKLVEDRRAQLELVMAQVEKDSGPEARADVDAALAALKSLLTGNLDHIPAVIAVELSQWIETSKYLGASQVRRLEEATRAAAAADEAAARTTLVTAPASSTAREPASQAQP